MLAVIELFIIDQSFANLEILAELSLIDTESPPVRNSFVSQTLKVHLRAVQSRLSESLNFQITSRNKAGGLWLMGLLKLEKWVKFTLLH